MKRELSDSELREISDKAALAWDLVKDPKPGVIYDTIDSAGRFGQAWLPGKHGHGGQEARGLDALWLSFNRKKYPSTTEDHVDFRAVARALVRRFFPQGEAK